MNGNLRIDRDILIPILVGTMSIIGICLALVVSRRPAPEPVSGALMTATVTPFQYKLLATETFTPDPSLVTEPPEIGLEEETVVVALPPTQDLESFETPLSLTSLPGTSRSLATNTTVTAGSPIATTTASTADEADEETVFLVGMYDDTDIRINYIGDWTSELFVDNAHEETLNVSTSSGNTAIFTFLGRQVVLGYLGSSDVDLGTATIAIDGNPSQLNQSTGSTWTSPQLLFDQHTVVITHQTGDLLFLDYIDVR